VVLPAPNKLDFFVLLGPYSEVQYAHGWLTNLPNLMFMPTSLSHQSGRPRVGGTQVPTSTWECLENGTGLMYSWKMYFHWVSHRPPLQHLHWQYSCLLLGSQTDHWPFWAPQFLYTGTVEFRHFEDLCEFKGLGKARLRSDPGQIFNQVSVIWSPRDIMNT